MIYITLVIMQQSINNFNVPAVLHVFNIPYFLVILVEFSHDVSPAHLDYIPQNLEFYKPIVGAILSKNIATVLHVQNY